MHGHKRHQSIQNNITQNSHPHASSVSVAFCGWGCWGPSGKTQKLLHPVLVLSKLPLPIPNGHHFPHLCCQLRLDLNNLNRLARTVGCLFAPLWQIEGHQYLSHQQYNRILFWVGYLEHHQCIFKITCALWCGFLSFCDSNSHLHGLQQKGAEDHLGWHLLRRGVHQQGRHRTAGEAALNRDAWGWPRQEVHSQVGLSRDQGHWFSEGGRGKTSGRGASGEWQAMSGVIWRISHEFYIFALSLLQ